MPSVTLQRAVPLLGTLVSIRATADDAESFHHACDAAFDHVARIQVEMSFHDAHSDLRALARANAGEIVPVGQHSYAVLEYAMALEQETDGVFNVCCAAALVARGVLPYPSDAQPTQASCLHEGVELLGPGFVSVLATPWIDLGGVAKGYAVDEAIKVLQAEGVTQGIVNAGGDLRCFGEKTCTVHVRDLFDSAHIHTIAEIRDLACATSAPQSSGQVTHILDARGPDHRDIQSVTVIAPIGMHADALTKIVWSRGQAACDLLQKYQAEAWVQCSDKTYMHLGCEPHFA